MPKGTASLDRFDHSVVLMIENRSSDSLRADVPLLPDPAPHGSQA